MRSVAWTQDLRYVERGIGLFDSLPRHVWDRDVQCLRLSFSSMVSSRRA